LFFSNQWYRIYCSCQGGSRSTGAKVSARICWDLFRVPVLAFAAILYITYYHGVCPVCKPWHEAQIVVRVTAHDPCRNRPSPDETTQRPPKRYDLNGQTSQFLCFLRPVSLSPSYCPLSRSVTLATVRETCTDLTARCCFTRPGTQPFQASKGANLLWRPSAKSQKS
jgi:hypothetical protein